MTSTFVNLLGALYLHTCDCVRVYGDLPLTFVMGDVMEDAFEVFRM